jgi:hypothetical protein
VSSPEKDITPFQWTVVTAFLLVFALYVFALGGC